MRNTNYGSFIIVIIIIIYPVDDINLNDECLIRAQLQWIQIVHLQNKPQEAQDSKLYGGFYQNMLLLLIM